MYGLPGQSAQRWSETLDKALSVTPEHLSIYELTLEENTPFAVQAQRGLLRLPAEDKVLAMMDVTVKLITTAVLKRYEISNYARPGRECRHNINYWQNGSYIGLGPGAVSCLSGRRLTAVADVEQFCRYLEIGKDFWSHEEALETEVRFRETVIMGLRMITGVSLERLRERFGINAIDYYGKTLSGMLDQDLLVVEDQFLRLTKKGLPVANAVMAELV
ncbi:MAG: hypothetical protein GQ559_05385 [Desulfobulbaceae bacterium]|nr:hypothetical protein [Desulfobulbaceae bacterium]